MLYLIGCLWLLSWILLKVIQKCTIGMDDSNACLIGKTAIITGAKRGIGYETALKFASRGCKVIIADIVDSKDSVKDIILQTNNPNVFYKCIDLGSFKSVRKFAEEIIQNEERLDILVNNAGCAGFEGVYSDDGILKSHQINYFGPFLLTHLLAGLLKKTTDSRIVFVASLLCFTHNLSSIDDFNKPAKSKFKFLKSLIDYSNNKVCTVIAANKFAEKLKKHGVSCSSLHPGIVSTAIYNTALNNSVIATTLMQFQYFMLGILIKIYGKTPSEGAQTTLYCALSPNTKKSIGGFYLDCRFFYTPSLTRNEKFCNDLWMESEKLTGLKPNEKLD